MRILPRKRRSTKLAERLTPCQACGYVLSQRHHLLTAARHGENNHTAYLCANCHEAYHALERGWIDIRAKRRNTHAIRIFNALWWAYGGRENLSFDKLCSLVEYSESLQQRNVTETDISDLFSRLFGPEDESENDVRRGDTVRLTNGKIVRVVSTQGGYVHTTDGTYGPWQVEKVAKA